MGHCPNCKTRFIRLAPQHGLIERLLGMFTIYPIRCQICSHRFLTFFGRREYIPQRDYQRVPVSYPAWVSSETPLDELAGQEGTVVNLSVGGCRMEGKFEADDGKRLRLQFEIGNDQIPVTVDEAVVHAQPGHAVGLRFTKLRKEERRRIGRVVRSRLSGVWVKSSLDY